MSMVTICDWCKKPFDVDQLKAVVFSGLPMSPPGSGDGTTEESYDLCPKCHGEVLSRLRSQKVQLPAVRTSASAHFDEEEESEQEDISSRIERKARRKEQRSADVWPEDRDAKIAAIENGKMPSRDDQPDDDPPLQRNRASGKKIFKSSRKAEYAGNKKKCPHMNKGPIRGIKVKDGIPWRQCLDCGKKIPMKRPDERSYQTPPPGCNLKSVNNRRG